MTPSWPSWSSWKNIVTCVPTKSVISRGIWLGDNPFTFSSPVFMLQIALSSLFTSLFHFLLEPLGVGSFFSHMVRQGAIVGGPSVLGRVQLIPDYIYSVQTVYILDTFQDFGTMFFLFLVGLKMNIGMVTSSGKKAWIIGLSAFLVPLLIALPVSVIVKHKLAKHGLESMLPVVALCECQTSFHVVISLLADVKLLNSEIGHLAMSSSLISNFFSWFSAVVLTIDASSMHRVVMRVGALVCMVMIVRFLMKPIMYWMIKQTPKESTMKEVHVFIVFLMVLLCSFFGQAVGQPIVFGPMILGLAVPTGPPLETTIEDKLESIVSLILLPTYYAGSVGRSNPDFITASGFILVQLIVILAFVGKLIGTVFAAMYYHMTLQHAFTLGLIMGSQGVVDLLHFRRALVFDMVSVEVYTLMTYSAIIVAGITSLLLKFNYKPSKQYTFSRRSIQNNRDSELRILACLYRESNARTSLDLLEASNATEESPIGVYLLHLLELQRVARPILVAHKRMSNKNHSVHYKRSKHIINAFRFFEKHKHGTVSLNSFTAVSPFTSMHEDICSIAIEKRTSLIILPFHRQLNIDGLLETITPIRSINYNVLRVSPCSVGILIDQAGIGSGYCTVGNKSLYRVGIIFLGGEDDREVLTYGMRMGEHPKTTLTVIRFLSATSVEENKSSDNTASTNRDKILDDELFHMFKNMFKGNERVTYREEVVRDGVAILKAMKWMDYANYDLMMVGRQHSGESPLVKGLTEWNEFPELGFLGDMLATSDAHHEVSILVVQQQLYISNQLLQNANYDSCTVKINL